MSGSRLPRFQVIGDDRRLHDVFEVVEVTGNVLRVKTAFRFELGEELLLRIEDGSDVVEGVARVKAHGTTTELEIVERSEPRRLVSG